MLIGLNENIQIILAGTIKEIPLFIGNKNFNPSGEMKICKKKNVLSYGVKIY